MDNLTHSLAGLAAGELLHRCLPVEKNQTSQTIRHRLLLISCCLSSNFPDLDLVLTPLLPEPLGYLLHHRGHTHTILYALPQALLICALISLLWPAARRLLKDSRLARVGFVASVGLGLGLHLAMDYLNSYGIHPFHPFDSRWYFGDLIFIVEPLFWVAFGVPLIMLLQKAWLRFALLAALAATLFFFTSKGYLSWPSLVFLLGIGAGLVLISRETKTPRSTALVAAATIGAIFVALQGLAALQGKQILRHVLKQRDMSSQLLDIALTPFPSNPMCWTFVSIEKDENSEHYRLRRGYLSVAPSIFPIHACPAAFRPHASSEIFQGAVDLHEQYVGSIETLRTLQRQNCHVYAWLRFARMPMLTPEEATDVRFSFSPRGNFTTLRFKEFETQPCPTHVPQWESPRKDLLTNQD